MAIRTVITEGFGVFGSVGYVVLEGFGALSVGPPATIITEAFGTLTGRSTFLVTEGFGAGSSSVITTFGGVTVAGVGSITETFITPPSTIIQSAITTAKEVTKITYTINGIPV